MRVNLAREGKFGGNKFYKYEIFRRRKTRNKREIGEIRKSCR